ncbi:MAG: carbamoyltransferase HypF [Dehalococcoidales bacterium]|nr:carbamoyltransferase HypF [Dehalococcoidales bacterium]
MEIASPKDNLIARMRIEVSGVVQGVGFRPFVYRLAYKYNLNGWVRNTSGNVAIEIEGQQTDLNRFIDSLKNEAPPVSHIQSISTMNILPVNDTGFRIMESKTKAGEYQPISGDIATCDKCLHEIFDTDDRRYLYPFTNCTNCGPRFTIIKDIPYDRPLTTMSPFKMCHRCQAEYDDPLDRRFHAQPNACPDCGPQLQLADNTGKTIESPDILKQVARLIMEGKIIAVKGMGGFQLACDATSDNVVKKLRQRKKRPGKPFALMMSSIEEIKKRCIVSDAEAELLSSAQAPIVLLKKRKDASDIAIDVAARNKYLGVMLPPTPLHHILLSYTDRPLVMTSGNLSEEPICKDNEEALQWLHNITDYFILHNRGIYARYDDSVYLVEKGEARAIRRARGYAPSPVMLPFDAKQVLACGGEEKNTFCLTRDKYAFLSQHIGDMDNTETLEHFENTIGLYKNLFRIQPEIIAYDLHPEYISTKYGLGYATENNLKAIGVQHHHAHIAGCMIENGIQTPVIGVAFDGTGYGTDGNLWGGEFFMGDFKGFERLAHLEYIPMAGGAAAIHKPYRMALSYIFTLLGTKTPLDRLPVLSRVSKTEVSTIKKQLEIKLNCPLTSSAGRLFDAVSALAGIRGVAKYEAQAAIELEMSAPDDINDIIKQYIYPFSTETENGMTVIRLRELIKAVIEDVAEKIPASIIAARFHRTIADIIIKTCKAIALKTGVNTIALSGGVFQNRLLLKIAIEGLENDGFKVLSHHVVPCNDGGIALGQAVIAGYNDIKDK